MIDTYLSYLRDVRRMSPNTLESYARDLSLLGRFADARKTPVEALTRRDLEAFVRELMSSGLSPRSVARAVACVRGFYKFTAVERKLAENPADDLRAPRAWPSLPKFLSLDEVDRLLEQPEDQPEVLHVLRREVHALGPDVLVPEGPRGEGGLLERLPLDRATRVVVAGDLEELRAAPPEVPLGVPGGADEPVDQRPVLFDPRAPRDQAAGRYPWIATASQAGERAASRRRRGTSSGGTWFPR